MKTTETKAERAVRVATARFNRVAHAFVKAWRDAVYHNAANRLCDAEDALYTARRALAAERRAAKRGTK